jgi:peptidase M15-like protein
MWLSVSWLRLALPATLLATFLYSCGEDSEARRRQGEPVVASDPHDTVTAPPDTAGSPLDLPAPGTASTSFAVKFKEEVSPYPVMALFVMPGESVPLEAVLGDTLSRFSAEAGDGRLERMGPARWRWVAPRRKGVSAIVVRDSATGEAVALNAFVLVPRPAGTTIDGFRLGRYEPRALRGDSNYARPRGLIEVTEENRGTFVAPHFTLGQFVSKQPGGYPKYLVLRERLLLKLEMLLEEASRLGLSVTTFQIMSGYRTPYYNQSIGNETRYSRHLYGDAADIYVDEDGDGVMDDLDDDGRVDLEDAKLLAAVVERLSRSSWYRPFEGGLGLYRANRAHGPFVHVDVRGYRARWGW